MLVNLHVVKVTAIIAIIIDLKKKEASPLEYVRMLSRVSLTFSHHLLVSLLKCGCWLSNTHISQFFKIYFTSIMWDVLWMLFYVEFNWNIFTFNWVQCLFEFYAGQKNVLCVCLDVCVLPQSGIRYQLAHIQCCLWHLSQTSIHQSHRNIS